ncbi:hypothetical protein Tco_0169154 [Tanacetum coccineum]
MVSPLIVTTSNIVTPTVKKTNDGFQTTGKKKKRKDKSKSINGGQLAGPSVKQPFRYESKASTSAPKKGATNVESVSVPIRFEYCFSILIGWTKVKAGIGESSLIGPKLVQDMNDKVVLIKEKLKAVVFRFGKKGKLAPRYVGPFEILERVGPVAYRLRLPEELSGCT